MDSRLEDLFVGALRQAGFDRYGYRQTWTIDAVCCIVIAAYCWFIFKGEMAKKARGESV